MYLLQIQSARGCLDESHALLLLLISGNNLSKLDKMMGLSNAFSVPFSSDPLSLPYLIETPFGQDHTHFGCSYKEQP